MSEFQERHEVGPWAGGGFGGGLGSHVAGRAGVAALVWAEAGWIRAWRGVLHRPSFPAGGAAEGRVRAPRVPALLQGARGPPPQLLQVALSCLGWNHGGRGTDPAG